AQGRLGAVGGLLAGLAADAIEGIPVPVWQAPVDEPREDKSREGDAREGEAPAEPHPKVQATNPYNPNASRKSQRRVSLPPEYEDPIRYADVTPEIVAVRAAFGRPL